MRTILLAILLGAVLGVVDGSTAWFTPEARPMLGSIILWSAAKDVIAGFLIGVFAVTVRRKWLVALFGLLVGLGFAWWVASTPDPETGRHYYVAIMLPGSLVGLLVGYLTARYGGRRSEAAPAGA